MNRKVCIVTGASRGMGRDRTILAKEEDVGFMQLLEIKKHLKLLVMKSPRLVVMVV